MQKNNLLNDDILSMVSGGKYDIETFVTAAEPACLP